MLAVLHELWIGVNNLDPVHAVHGTGLLHTAIVWALCGLALVFGVKVVLNWRQQAFYMEAPINHPPMRLGLVLRVLRRLGIVPIDEAEHPAEMDLDRGVVRIYLTFSFW